MNTAVATTNGHIDAAMIESVMVRGDLAKMTPAARNNYYLAVCKSVGLNPLTKPFEYLTLNGKMVLYALRNATDQLRAIHRISVVDMSENERDGIIVVTCKVQNAEGRTDVAKGAVSLASLKGEALANAIMKAETKAKRRATLSICGLSMLDETEVEDIPAARQNPHIVRPADIVDVPETDSEDYLPAATDGIRPLSKKDARPIFDALQKELNATGTVAAAKAWNAAARPRAEVLPHDWRETLSGLYKEHKASLMSKGDGLDIPASLRREPPADPEGMLGWIDSILAAANDKPSLEAAWNARIETMYGQMFPPDQTEAMGLYRKHEARVS